MHVRKFEKRADVKREGTFLLDWLEFTFMPGYEYGGNELWMDFMDAFPEFEDEFANTIMMPKGQNGYTNVYRFTDLYSISFSPDDSRMGVHVTFPSHGLSKLCELFNLESVDDYAPAQQLFQILNDRNCRVTRLDICYDDYTKYLKPEDFANFMLQGRISSKHRHWIYNSSMQGSGSTFYLGRRGRDRLFRCYDKAYESGGVIDAIRYELELKGDWAKQLQKDIAEGKKFKFSEMLNDMFFITNEYKRDDGASADLLKARKHQAGVAPEWLELLKLFDKARLDESNEIKIDRIRRVPSWTRLFNWINKQVLPNLYIFREVMGGDYLDEVIAIQEGRLNDIKQNMLIQYKLEVGEDEHGKSFVV